ncbi:MAG: DNA repair protein RadA [Eubacterium sp.]|nr:DNA repair protein RadA [Eubacterium sp.]
MAKKTKTVYVCQECGYESPKWMGQCICGAWGSFVEEKVDLEPENDPRSRNARGLGGAGSFGTGGGRTIKPSVLRKVGSADYERISTGIGELDRVLGGGLVKGSLVLISGEPGIGKSTLIVQAAAHIAKNCTVLYVSGEESEEQIKMRADRVCPDLGDSLYVMSETNMENIENAVDDLKPSFLIIDSIQTMYTGELDSAPGSVSQVRACGNILMKYGKTRNIPVFIVAHVTKSGDLAGPKIVEHLVDCVLNFTGERDHDIRILRAFKNRFGTASEIGAFQMGEDGLTEITDLSASFLENTDEQAEGSVITAVYEGSRPVLLEVQALTSSSGVQFARRTAVGIDNQRLAMILAVIEKKLGMFMGDQDVYVNVVGGLRPDSTSVDLGVALAIYSSMRGITPGRRMIAVGEVGLTGDLRSCQNADRIAAEAAKLGYSEIIMPARNASKIAKDGMDIKVTGVKNIYEAVNAFKN